MVSYFFNNRPLQFLDGSFHIDELFTRNDGIYLLDAIIGEVTNQQLNIRRLVDRFFDPRQQQIDLAVITCLVFHLTHLEQPVNCEVVKPFLPWQADKELKIGAQTPITAHIAECHDCYNDVGTLTQLNLEQKQLVRLGELFAGGHHRSLGNCKETKKSMRSIAEMNFSAATAEVLRHVCLCTKCRRLLYKERNKMYSHLLAKSSPPFLCESVSATDIFAYTVPYGLDPANDQYAKFRPSFTSHLSKCSICLEKILKLHNTTFTILERPDSGIVTHYGLDES